MARAAPGFSVTITATDRATATINQVNKSLERMAAPVRALNAQTARLADITGLTRLARTGLSVSSALGGISGPLGLITGAGVLSGMVSMTRRWEEMSTQLTRASERIGTTSARLQTLQGAARLAGSSADAMTTGMRSLQDAMTDSVGGRNGDLLRLFTQLKVDIGVFGGEARRAEEILPALADKIAALRDPSVQARVAMQLFGSAGEQLLPMLRKGSAGIRALEEETRRLGIASATAGPRAEELRGSLARLGVASDALGGAVAERLAPGLAVAVNRMTDLTVASRKWIETDLDSYTNGPMG